MPCQRQIEEYTEHYTNSMQYIETHSPAGEVKMESLITLIHTLLNNSEHSRFGSSAKLCFHFHNYTNKDNTN